MWDQQDLAERDMPTDPSSGEPTAGAGRPVAAGSRCDRWRVTGSKASERRRAWSLKGSSVGRCRHFGTSLEAAFLKDPLKDNLLPQCN